jgi:hypothetical protein
MVHIGGFGLPPALRLLLLLGVEIEESDDIDP